MKKLLLTSALVAVAGTSFAEILWTGDAEFGFNDHTKGETVDEWTYVDADGDEEIISSETYWYKNEDGDGGLYLDGDLDVIGMSEIDNGGKASVKFGIDLEYFTEESLDEDGGLIKLDDFPTVMIEYPQSRFAAGEVEHAAYEIHDDVIGMYTDFTDRDDELVARLDTTVSDATVGVSYSGEDSFGDYGLAEGSTSMGVKGEVSNIMYTVGYEHENDTDDETFGIGGGYIWNDTTFKLAYGKHNEAGTDIGDGDSLGLGAEYELANGIVLDGGIAWNAVDKGGDDKDHDYFGWGLEARGDIMGADMRLGIENEDTSLSGNTENYADLSYVYNDAIKVIVGYDSEEEIVMYDDMQDRLDDQDVDGRPEEGAFYVGASYLLGSNGSEAFVRYSNADEIDPNEDFKPGTSFGVSLSF